MIYGLGNDILEIDRIERLIIEHGQKFLDKIFTVKEQQYCNKYKDSSGRFAGRFAAKEAIVKALGTGFSQGISWLDIEIVNDTAGKPTVLFSEKVTHLFSSPEVMVSISHCKKMAIATAIRVK